MATTFLDPDGDVTNQWTKSAGTVSFSLVDDAVRQPTAPTTGSDRLTTSTDGQITEVSLGTFTLGGYRAVTQVIAWWHGANGSVAKSSVDLGLYTGATPLATTTVTAITETWYSVTYTGSLTQAQIDDLRIRLTYHESSSTVTTAVANELYAEVTTAVNAETGSLTCGGLSSGADADVYSELASVTASGWSSGADVDVFAELASVAASGSAGGADASTRGRAGAVTPSGVASGADAAATGHAGSVRANGAVSGADARTAVESGSLVTPYLGASYGTVILQEGPFAYVKFSDAGASQTDYASPGRSASLSGTYVTGQSAIVPAVGDQTVTFGDGVSNTGAFTLDVGTALGLSAITAEVWISLAASGIGSQLFWNFSRFTSGTSHWQVEASVDAFGGASYTVAITDGGGSEQLLESPDTSNIAPGTHYLVFVYDGTDAILYVDAVERVRMNLPGLTLANSTLIQPTGTALYAEATVSHLALYDYALTPATIRSHYRLGQDGSGYGRLAGADSFQPAEAGTLDAAGRIAGIERAPVPCLGSVFARCSTLPPTDIDILDAGVGGTHYISGSNAYIAQSFLAPSTGALAAVTLQLIYFPPDFPPEASTIYVEVRTDNSNEPGTSVLTTASRPADDISQVEGIPTVFTFSSPASLTSGVRYWLVLHQAPLGFDNDGTVGWLFGATDVYPDGGFEDAPDGATWSGFSNTDMLFATGMAATAAGALSGADVYEPSETAALLAAGLIAGADAYEPTEAGTLAASALGSGSDAVVFAELASLLAGTLLPGVEARQAGAIVKVGALLASMLLAGADAAEFGELGSLLSPVSVAGGDEFNAVEAGALAAASLAVGADAYEAAETASLAASVLAAGEKARDAVETGSLTAAGEASGADAGEFAETAAFLAAVLSGGADSYTAAETGTLATAVLAAGADVYEAAETAALIAAALVAGAEAKESPGKDGTLTAGASVSGAGAVGYTEAAALVAVAAVAGEDSYTAAEAGALVASALTAGAKLAEYTEAGLLVAAGELSGTDAATLEATAALLAAAVIAGADETVSAETASVAAGALTAGADEYTAAETGILATAALLAGIEARQVAGKEGSLTNSGLVSGADAVSASETATILAGALLAAADAFQAVEAGALMSRANMSISDVYEASETGALAAAAFLAGADVYVATEQGTFATAVSLSGADARIAAETAALIAGALVAGADSYNAAETGSIVTSAFLAGAELKPVPDKTGALAAHALGSGADATIHAETSALVAGTFGSAADVAEHSETGTLATRPLFDGQIILVLFIVAGDVVVTTTPVADVDLSTAMLAAVRLSATTIAIVALTNSRVADLDLAATAVAETELESLVL